MKLLNTTLLALFLTTALSACEGAVSPFTITTTIEEDIPDTTSPIITLPNTSPTTLPITGSCLDYEPLNDGIGWNGVSECPLDVTVTEYVEVPINSKPAVEPVIEPNYAFRTNTAFVCAVNNANMSDPSNYWIWTFAPNSSLTDPLGVSDGSWSWLSKDSVSIYPTGNDTVIAIEKGNGVGLSLHNSNMIQWGWCEIADNSYVTQAIEYLTQPVVTADILENQSYDCSSSRGARVTEHRTLDGFGVYSAVYIHNDGLTEGLGNYSLIDDRVWFGSTVTDYNTANYFKINEDLTLTYSKNASWICYKD